MIYTIISKYRKNHKTIHIGDLSSQITRLIREASVRINE